LPACPLFFFTFVLKPKSHERMRTLSQNWQNWVVAALASTWLAAQNVGIGTTTPLTRLHVAAGDIFLGEAAGNNGFILHSRSGTGYDFLQITSRTAGSYEWGKGITFVRSTGNVGIGTTAPGAKLDILQSSTGDLSRILRIGAGGSTLWSLGITDAAGTYFRIASEDLINNPPFVIHKISGNVGIGTTAPHSAAILQLQATDKGFLPTRVALTSAISWSPLVGTSVDGMLVYNTATAGTGQNAVSPGYYYWRAGRWRRFSENAYAGMIQGVLSSAAQNLTTDQPSWQYLNSYIDLPPGKWIVYSVQLLRPSSISGSGSIWVRTKFSDDPTTCVTTADFIGNAYLISGLLPNSAEYSLVMGQIIINNTSGTTKRYYYCGHKQPYGGYNANLVNFSTTLQGENQLYALPAE
jgi:hypothetical protein